jgi:hypothetical protein
MKKYVQLLPALALMIMSASCQHSGNVNPQLVGNWKMTAIHIKQYDDQVAQLKGEVQSLTDSLSGVKDSASMNRIQSNLDMYNHYLSDMQARKDSGLKNTYWNFKSDGKFSGQESADKKYNGYWEYNEKSKTITRYLPSDSVKVEVKGDTLILNLDSLNHITFVKSGK